MQTRQKKWAIVGLAIGLIVLLIAVSTRVPPQGPARLQVDRQGQVWVLAGKSLFVLSSDGELRARHALPEAHALTSASDFALLSSGDVLLADAVERDVLQCDAQVKACRSIYKSQGKGGGALGNSLKLLVDEPRDTLWLADTVNHRLLQLALTGTYRQQFGSGFYYPNQIGFSGAGDLVVADTDHHRIAAFDPAGDFTTPRWQISGKHEGSRYPRIRPSAFAEVGPNWWVIAEDHLMKNGDVLSFKPDGTPLARILPEAVDPLSIVVTVRQVLVADAGHFSVRRAGLDGSAGGLFGDAAFQRELRAMRDTHRQQRWLMRGLPVLIAAIALLAALLLKRLGEPVSAPQAAWPQWQHDATQKIPRLLAPNEQLWIEPYPQHAQRLARQRRQLWLLMALPGLMILLIAAINFEKSPQATAHILGLSLPLLLLLPLVSHWQSRSQGMGIGVETGAVLLRDHKGQISRHPSETVRHNNRVVLIGQHLIPLMTLRDGAVYPPEQIRDVLLARLPEQAFLDDWQFQWHLLRIRHPLAIGTAILLLLMTAYLLFF